MRFWLALSGLLVFAAGGALGFLVYRSMVAGTEQGGMPIQAMYVEGLPYLVTSEEVYRDLELDGHQREQIERLLADHYRRVRAARAALLDLTVDLRSGVDRVLQPDQRKTFEEIQKRYGEREIQEHVAHELMNLRAELGLAPEQEPSVYQILYDSARDGREVMRALPRGEDRRTVHKKWAEIVDRRDGRIMEVLTGEQSVRYAELRERERRLRFERDERHERKNEKPGGDEKPSPKPAATPS